MLSITFSEIDFACLLELAEAIIIESANVEILLTSSANTSSALFSSNAERHIFFKSNLGKISYIVNENL
jgi:hypothetical protein